MKNIDPIIVHKSRKHCYREKDILVFYDLFERIVEDYDLTQNPVTAATILIELIKNAEKANAKRVILNSPEIYEKKGLLFHTNIDGMVVHHFKDDIDFPSILEGSDKWVEVVILIDDDNIRISITNNSSLQSNEKFRINRVLHLAKENMNFIDLYDRLNPQAEMGGIGLAMSFHLLKAEGLDVDNIQVLESEDNTTTNFIYPPILRDQIAV